MTVAGFLHKTYPKSFVCMSKVILGCANKEKQAAIHNRKKYIYVSLILFFLNYGNKDKEKTGTSKIKPENLFCPAFCIKNRAGLTHPDLLIPLEGYALPYGFQTPAHIPTVWWPFRPDRFLHGLRRPRILSRNCLSASGR